MPSGAKKRKAARRRKEEDMEPGPVQPQESSTTDSFPENGQDGKENTSNSSSSSSSSSSDEAESKESNEPAVALEVEEIAIIDEVKIPVSMEAEPVSVQEFVHVEKSDMGLEEPAAAVVAAMVPTDAPIPVDEETVETVAAAAEILETTLEIDSLSHEAELKLTPLLEETPGVIELPRDSGETRRDTEIPEPTPVPLAVHRASWWNCCGLFDVLTGSKDNIRKQSI